MDLRSVVCVLACALCAPASFAQLTVTVRNTGVRACGFAPDAKVVLWGVEWEARDWAPRFTTLAVNREVNGEGCARLRRTVPPVAVWVAVDLGTGEAAAAANSNWSPRLALVNMDRSALADLPDGGGLGLVVKGEDAEVLLVRPGEGAWYGSVADGGSFDHDKERDGFVLVSSADLRPIAGDRTPAPANLQSGDVLIATPARHPQPARLVVE